MEKKKKKKFQHHPGTKNSKADTLSCYHDPVDKVLSPEPIHPPTVIIAPICWDLMEEILRPLPQNANPMKQYVPTDVPQRVLQWIHTSRKLKEAQVRMPCQLAWGLPEPHTLMPVIQPCRGLPHNHGDSQGTCGPGVLELWSVWGHYFWPGPLVHFPCVASLLHFWAWRLMFVLCWVTTQCLMDRLKGWTKR